MFHKRPTVLVHDSKYHADDIFAVAVLELALGKIKIVRSRDKEKIAAADYVADVGGMYDPVAHRYDHHQAGGAGVRENGIPYAAFGLVWKDFGGKLCGSEKIAADIDKKLVQPLDAHDNGRNIYALGKEEVEPYGLHRLFQSTLPTWKEEMVSKKDLRDQLFMQNVELAKKILEREIIRARDKEEANVLVEAAFQKAADKRLLILDTHYPWGDVAEAHPEILFVISQRTTAEWDIQAVQKEKGNFGNRKDLPAAWGGKYDSELEQITGVPGAFFCHRALFLAAARTKEGALRLAEIALKS